MYGIAGEHLKAFVDRIERLEEEKAAIGDDIKAVYAEAKSTGYDVATIRKIVKLRKISEAERQEQDELLDLYMSALGMLKGTPLGDYMAREFSEKKEGGAEDHGLESDVAQAEEQIGSEAEQPQGEAVSGPGPETEAASPDADWGDDHLDQKDGDDGATAGFAYREGERAAQEGIAIKELLKAHNKHHLCAWAKSAKAGYEAELKRQAREQQTEESAGLEVAPLNVVSMVPLPKLTDGVATSSGDAA